MVPKYAVGQELYFCPSIERIPFGSRIPAGRVTVTEVVDHGVHEYDPRPRWTYVVHALDYTLRDRTQGASENELYVLPEGN